MTNYWDADGDFDYEAQYEANQRKKAAATAEWIGYPGMTDAFHHFGLHDKPTEAFTPELLTAMDTWQVLLERIEGTTDEVNAKELRHHHRAIECTILDLIITSA